VIEMLATVTIAILSLLGLHESRTSTDKLVSHLSAALGEDHEQGCPCDLCVGQGDY